MKCVILNFNRLLLTKNTVEWCLKHSLEPVIIDNASDYQPLLDYYSSKPCEVLRLDRNYGHKVLWEQWLFRKLGITDRYLLTDPDLDLSGVPDDFLQVMHEGLDRYPVFDRIGLSLEIDDLPNNDLGRSVYKHEIRFWNNPLDSLYYEAEVDTTFALHKITNYNTYNSLRVGKPYTARHLPWYYTDFNSLSDDEKNYFQTANNSFSWKDRIIS